MVSVGLIGQFQCVDWLFKLIYSMTPTSGLYSRVVNLTLLVCRSWLINVLKQVVRGFREFICGMCEASEFQKNMRGRDRRENEE